MYKVKKVLGTNAYRALNVSYGATPCKCYLLIYISRRGVEIEVTVIV
jgi:hypothetical protein